MRRRLIASWAMMGPSFDLGAYSARVARHQHLARAIWNQVEFLEHDGADPRIVAAGFDDGGKHPRASEHLDVRVADHCSLLVSPVRETHADLSLLRKSKGLNRGGRQYQTRRPGIDEPLQPRAANGLGRKLSLLRLYDVLIIRHFEFDGESSHEFSPVHG